MQSAVVGALRAMGSGRVGKVVGCRHFHGTSLCMEGVVKSTRGLPADVAAATVHGFRHQSPHCLDIQWSDHKWGAAVQVNKHRDVAVSVDQGVDSSLPGRAFAKMKCVKDYEGQMRIFRPEVALDRFHEQCLDKGLPKFNDTELLECIASLLRVDSAWIPDAYGYSMDVAIETEAGSSREDGRLVCVLNPRAPVDRCAYTAKVCGDQDRVKEKLAQHVLMLDSKVFRSAGDSQADAVFLLMEPDKVTRKRELVTAPVPANKSGPLRSSILQLASQHGDMIVTEKDVSVEEALAFVRERRVTEMFATVSQEGIHPVPNIHHQGGNVHVSYGVSLASRLDAEIADIEYGRHTKSDAWTRIVPLSSL